MGVAGVAGDFDGLGEADEDGLARSDRAGQLLDRALVGGEEVALKVEVLGRVAGYAELREDRQLRALLGGAADPVGDLGAVAVDVADGRVDLGEGYAHGAVRAITAEVSPSAGPRWAEAPARVPPMRDRRRHLVGFSVAALLLLGALPAVAAGAPGLADAVPSLASPSQKPFVMPKPRPTEGRSRPTDDPDPNRSTYTAREAAKSPACSLHFCVHWVAKGIDAPDLRDSDGDRVPNFVEQVLRIAEEVHEIENEQLGWREPKSDGKLGGGVGKTDIYLAQMGAGLFGYTAPDPGQATKEHPIPRRLHGYLLLDNDYSAFEFPGTKPVEDLRVTLAHEYNHIIQFGYDAYQDPWFAEATATWMEDLVYDEIDDYLRYMRRWVKLWDTPLTTSSIKEYGSAVWNQWLAERYGAPIVRRAWAEAIHARPGGFSVAAYDAAIRAAGRSDFAHDFAHFAAAVAEWGTGEGFSESRRYPDMRRQGSLPLNGRTLTRTLNHTTFSLLRVRARGGRAVVVGARAPRGVATGLVLVGRLGGERSGSTVARLDFSRGGGKLVARLNDPGRYSRITAVLVNADASANGFSARRLDWDYLTDGIPFEVRGRLLR